MRRNSFSKILLICLMGITMLGVFACGSAPPEAPKPAAAPAPAPAAKPDAPKPADAPKPPDSAAPKSDAGAGGETLTEATEYTHPSGFKFTIPEKWKVDKRAPAF
jgi:hypothetical protein